MIAAPARADVAVPGPLASTEVPEDLPPPGPPPGAGPLPWIVALASLIALAAALLRRLRPR